MQRRDHREGEAENAEPDRDHEIEARHMGAADHEGEHERNGCEHGTPETRFRHFARETIGAASDDGRCDRLHEAVADRPARDEAGHLHVAPALAVEKHRQADDKPHIARAEQEHARRRHQIDAARLGEEFAEGFRRLRLAERARQANGDAEKHGGESRRHQPKRALEADRLQQQAADEEAGALHRVLGTGEPGDPFEQAGPSRLRRSP